MDRRSPGEVLPALHDDIDISGADLEAATPATCHFGAAQRCARAGNRIITALAGRVVMTIRRAMHLAGLFRPCPPPGLARSFANRMLLATSQTVVCLRSPCQWLG